MLNEPAPDRALVIFTRDTGMIGKACALTVFVDDVPAADLMAGERTNLYVRPGVRIISAAFQCGERVGKRAAAETTAELGKTRSLHFGVNGESFEQKIEPAPF